MLLNQEISLSRTVSQVKGNIVSDMSGEKVMLSIKNGKYYNLGEVGGYIWDLIEEPISLSSVVALLMDTFEVDHTECEDQVLSFVEEIVKEGLVEVRD